MRETFNIKTDQQAEALNLAGIDRASGAAGYYGRNVKAADNHQ